MQGSSRELLGRVAGFGRHPPLPAQVLCLGSPEVTRDFATRDFTGSFLPSLRIKTPWCQLQRECKKMLSTSRNIFCKCIVMHLQRKTLNVEAAFPKDTCMVKHSEF